MQSLDFLKSPGPSGRLDPRGTEEMPEGWSQRFLRGKNGHKPEVLLEQYQRRCCRHKELSDSTATTCALPTQRYVLRPQPVGASCQGSLYRDENGNTCLFQGLSSLSRGGILQFRMGCSCSRFFPDNSGPRLTTGLAYTYRIRTRFVQLFLQCSQYCNLRILARRYPEVPQPKSNGHEYRASLAVDLILHVPAVDPDGWLTCMSRQ
jgi:hypothetical protein